MASIAKSVEIDLPVSTVYNQWTQFEEFPRFMSGITEVVQLTDKTLRWKANIAGRTEEWHAEITEQVPDQKIAWRATSGALNAGIVSFDKVADNKTRVHLELFYDPQGVAENVGDALGVVSARVSGDLQRFKEYIEGRGAESGAWRGEIHHGEVSSSGEKNLGSSGPDVTGVSMHGNTPGGPGPVGVGGAEAATSMPTAESLPGGTRRSPEEDEISPEA